MLPLSHPCLARNDFRLAGMFFFIDILGSPKRTRRIFDPSLANTADFFDLPGVRFGLLYPLKRSPLYVIAIILLR
tara:strand:- start:409 stop:633 length:225 start_codon:yes stop_codon:yes gene_type:complete